MAEAAFFGGGRSGVARLVHGDGQRRAGVGFVDAGLPFTQARVVSQTSNADLPQLGREAAERVPGLGKVEKVSVWFGQDSADEPAVYFSFLIDQGQDRQQAGLIRTRLIQELRDELLARGQERYPIEQVLDRADWERQFGAL
ncbi:MAG: hypothetical protein ICV73_16545 [Acetobacteraceae bacterium]|nr:hypothetical protein [Acetobacteraceae bacterium]